MKKVCTIKYFDLFLRNQKQKKEIMDLKFSEIAADTIGNDADGYAPVDDVTDGGVFVQRTIRSEYFPCSAWVCSNFGVMSDSVWIGYKFGYYPLVFLPVLTTLFGIDVSILFIRNVVLYVLKRIFDFVIDGIKPFAKIIMGAAAVVLVTLFLSNQGWDGLNALYKTMCEWLSGSGK